MSTFPPKKCGIAVYTEHLRNSLIQTGVSDSVPIIVLTESDVELEQMRRHCSSIHDKFFFIRKHVLDDFKRVAMEINQSEDISVVSLQHEFSFFGGVAGSFVLEFLRDLTKPVVTTFHTVSQSLPAEYHEVLRQTARLSRSVITLNYDLRLQMAGLLGIPLEKIFYLPCGAPNLGDVNREAIRQQIGWNNRKIMFTFGLLSRNKGLELVLDALPDVVKLIPDVLYVILGQTHPYILEIEGEAYRNSLRQIIADRGLENHVLMVDQYVPDEQIIQYLAACDLYITPYRDMNQAISATLAYAVGLQRPVLSTPYSYAKDLLKGFEELLIPPDDKNAWKTKIIQLLTQPRALDELSNRMQQTSSILSFPRVARLFQLIVDP